MFVYKQHLSFSLTHRSAEDGVDARKLLAIAQEQLRKRNYEGFAKLIESFQQADREKYVNISSEAV